MQSLLIVGLIVLSGCVHEQLWTAPTNPSGFTQEVRCISERRVPSAWTLLGAGIVWMIANAIVERKGPCWTEDMMPEKGQTKLEWYSWH